MVTPRWVQTRTQPVALGDAVSYLAGVAGRDDTIGATFEIGGPEALTYRDMLLTVAALTGRRRLIVPVPVLSPRLSSWWLRVVTDVDLTTARALVDSMSNEVVVTDGSLERILAVEPRPFETAARAALAARARRRGPTDRAGATGGG